MKSDSEILAEELMKKNDIAIKLLGKRIKKQNERCELSLRKIDKIRDQLLKLFINSIDENSSKKLILLLEAEKKYLKYFKSISCWNINRDGATYEDGHTMMQDPEFRYWNSYRIVRDSEGYYVVKDSKGNSLSEEINFYESKKDELEFLHLIYSEKENIMFGNYNSNNKNMPKETLERIALYLGYNPESLKSRDRNKHKEKEKQKEKQKVKVRTKNKTKK